MSADLEGACLPLASPISPPSWIMLTIVVIEHEVQGVSIRCNLGDDAIFQVITGTYDECQVQIINQIKTLVT